MSSCHEAMGVTGSCGEAQLGHFFRGKVVMDGAILATVDGVSTFTGRSVDGLIFREYLGHWTQTLFHAVYNRRPLGLETVVIF